MIYTCRGEKIVFSFGFFSNDLRIAWEVALNCYRPLSINYFWSESVSNYFIMFSIILALKMLFIKRILMNARLFKSTRIKISPSLPTRCIRNSLSMHVTMLLFHQVNNLLTAGDIRLYARTYNKYNQ